MTNFNTKQVQEKEWFSIHTHTDFFAQPTRLLNSRKPDLNACGLHRTESPFSLVESAQFFLSPGISQLTGMIKDNRPKIALMLQ